MNKFNLQRFAELADTTQAVQGKQMVLLVRPISLRKNAAELLALETEHSLQMSKDASTTATKSGSIRTPGQAEVEISASSILAKGDTMIASLKKAMNDDELLDIWRVNLAEPGTGANKFKGTYYQGYITSLELSAPADGQVEASMTYGINGVGVDGECTVSAEQVEEALYAFKDTVAEGA